MKHLMLDLETLGTKPGAVFTQIGWAVFVPGRKRDRLVHGNIRVDVQSAIDAGLTIDASTFFWWLEQSEAARRSMLRPGIPLASALDALDAVYRDYKPEQVWAKPPAFDISILDVGYQRLGRKAPWYHGSVRCLRTLIDLRPGRVYRAKLPHDAESDAIAQALTAAVRLK